MNTRRFLGLGWCGAAILLAGCAGYRLGPTSGNDARSRSVQVNFFRNEAPEPRLSEAVAHALRKQLQQEGTYTLATHNDGDIVVNGVLLAYERSPVAYQPGDVTTVRDYEITLRAHVVAEERSTGRVVLDEKVRGRATVRIGARNPLPDGQMPPVLAGDQASVERQTLPILAADLARNITARLVDGAW
ncbi:MAG: hypothetical protein KA191_03595 [Verrucomicrobia bacterium]|jgi:hypothetical protein|nr:hypothetical protein [Verrucomicrobiota bacterium]OQC65585.1 MAG: hypothetical protein BWX48_02335 [Verrucomicrobia bacterium ADurb.Bin006]MDI9380519.1 LPS assembly lipoprotein LptE [Verrucomicrobiota bacterium]NMD22147.1 hypothetical protein [Verrucomicrobiota bacterium]HNU99837.1 LPS assembly lipoprotein LptE [Verrucomicrobiota bacterium]